MPQAIHHQLPGLKALWNHPDELLNEVLWVNTDEEDPYRAIGHAAVYLHFMEAYEYNSPRDAWEEWCIEQEIEHEIDNNPYTL